MQQESAELNKDLIFKTLAMPADTNQNGDIFGGWLMAQIDIAGGIYAAEFCGGRVTTVHVDAITFLRPVAVGDIVCFYISQVRQGRTSLTLDIEVWIKKISDAREQTTYKVTDATVVYVAIDNNGKARKI